MASDDVEKQVVSSLVDDLLPKISRGGFVVSLWSVFEACAKDLAQYAKNQRNVPFGLQDLRAGDFLEQTDKFFDRVLGLRAFPDKAVRKSLEELKGFRNALAHHDGNTREVPKSLFEGGQKRLQRVCVYSDLHHEYAVPTAGYVADALSLVSAYLEQLAENVYATLHPAPAQTNA